MTSKALSPVDFNRRMVNLWIAMCRGVPGLPRFCKDLNYVDRFIEPRLALRPTAPGGKAVEINPELIISSEKVEHTMLFEWKSGKNVDEEQLVRYSQVKQGDLTKQPLSLGERETRRHDLVLIALGDQASTIKIGISKAGVTFPLLLADEDGLRLDGTVKFSADEVNSVFSPSQVLPINWAEVPMEFLPIDGSTPNSEVAVRIVTCAVEAMGKRLPQMEISELCSRVCELTWSMLSRKGKEEITAKVRHILEAACSQHFKEYWKLNGSHLQFYNNPLELYPNKATIHYKKLEKAQELFHSYLQMSEPLFERGSLAPGDGAAAATATPQVSPGASPSPPLMEGGNDEVAAAAITTTQESPAAPALQPLVDSEDQTAVAVPATPQAFPGASASSPLADRGNGGDLTPTASQVSPGASALPPLVDDRNDEVAAAAITTAQESPGAPVLQPLADSGDQAAVAAPVTPQAFPPGASASPPLADSGNGAG